MLVMLDAALGRGLGSAGGLRVGLRSDGEEFRASRGLVV